MLGEHPNYFKEKLVVLVMKYIPLRKYVLRDSRHIRWNWERSPVEEGLIRYHFIVVNDKGRERIMDKILAQLQKVSPGIESIRKLEGRVANSKMGYLFESFDSSLAPSVIDWKGLGTIKRDPELYERKKGSENIKDYVADFYER